MTFRQRRDESGFRHRMRVRMHTLDGPKGRLFHCDGRNGKFWKVRLENGEWVWPDGIVVDGPGDRLHPGCLECRLPFRGDVGDLLCNHCQNAHFGTDAEHQDDGCAVRTSTYHRRPWRGRSR